MNKINMDGQQTNEKCSIPRNANSAMMSHILLTSKSYSFIIPRVGKTGGKDVRTLLEGM